MFDISAVTPLFKRCSDCIQEDFPLVHFSHSDIEGIMLDELEKEMATHSSVLAWRIPGTGEPGGLPSMGSHRVGHD